MKIAAIILAAGSSSRFGSPKQLALIDGRTLTSRVVEAAFEGGVDEVFVVVGANAGAVATSVEDLPVTVVVNKDWRDGLSSSLKTGIHALDESFDAALVMLADQPNVDSSSVHRLIDVFAGSDAMIVASHYDDTIGVPAIFARATFGSFDALSGDVGAKPLFAKFKHDLATVEMPEAAFDIDTPDDLKKPAS